MSKKNTPKAVVLLYRFINDIYRYFIDKGIPSDTAKVKTFYDVYDVVFDVYKKGEDAHDHTIVLTSEHLVRMLNERGRQLTKLYQENTSVVEQSYIRNEMKLLSNVKEQLKYFNENYKGVENGDKNESEES